MKIVGCDLHARQQSIALLDRETGEFLERTLDHEPDQVREFYSKLDGRVVVGIEATGAMQWFLELMDELRIECRVGGADLGSAGLWRTGCRSHPQRSARCRKAWPADGGRPAGPAGIPAGARVSADPVCRRRT